MAFQKEQILKDLAERRRSEVDFAFMDGPLPHSLPQNIREIALPAGTLPPFWPFLALLQESWQLLDQDRQGKILSNPGIYFFHREVWQQILAGGEPVRKEEILPGEMDYEYRRFRQDLRLIAEELIFSLPQVFLALGACRA